MLRTAFRDWFGIQDNQADLLVLLFDRQGRPMSCKAIGQALQSHRPLTVGAVHERVRVLRQSMEAESLDSDSRGYFLSAVGMSECRKSLQAMARALLGQGFELKDVPGNYEFEVGG
jgi:hypothetical protein